MNKKSIWTLIVGSLLLLGNVALICYNAIETIPVNDMNATFIISLAFAAVGVIGLILLIKPLFHKFYTLFLPIVDNAEEWSQARVVSEKKAYRTLEIANIVILGLSLLLQVLAIFVS